MWWPLRSRRDRDRSSAGLRKLADACGVRLGCAVSARGLDADPAYRETLASAFNLVTPENALKFGPLRPTPDTFSFGEADAIVAFAQEQRMEVRGHTLLWHKMNPSWLKPENFTRGELAAVLERHIKRVVTHYKGVIRTWDVVNEAIGGTGTLRPSPWLEGLGPEYVTQAFRWAHEADPGARLFYNDYGADGLNRKSDAIHAFLEELVAENVPIHGVGLQMHVTLGSEPAKKDVAANMARFAELGLEVQVTEMDVACIGRPTRKMLRRQARVYEEMLEAVLGCDSATAFIVWGLTDAHSWIPYTFPGKGWPLLFDEEYQPKPAYWAVRDALASETRG